MRLYYLNKQGEQKDIELSEKPLTIGRSADADVLILDEKASRVHCGIRYWDGDFYIKDLKSKNGTFVNDNQIDIHLLKPGDRIRVGSSVFVFEQEASPGTDTALEVMQGEFNHGKGYSTILREIVGETDASGSPAGAAERAAPVEKPPPVPLTPPSEPVEAPLAESTETSPPRKKPVLRKRKLAGSKRASPRTTRDDTVKPVRIKRRKPDADGES